MASNVVVIDSSARRTTVKTTPSKYLSDVLEEACSKLGLTSSQYGLKNNNKQVDLSRTIRLSGLSAGAKLELVQLSKSAGVVSVALQLPDSEAQGTPNARLTDKFPSTTTLWLILRKFEAGVAGGPEGKKRNFTARGVPSTSGGNTGAGRLYYERPVLQVMGRELSSFTDLQKSLAQLGFNSGTTLLRLSFRTSDTPLEEAMAEIEGYFRSVDGPAPEAEGSGASAVVSEVPTDRQQGKSKVEPEWTSEEANAVSPDSQAQSSLPSALTTDTTATTTTSGRPLSVFLPPSSSTPSAATSAAFNPSDYTPSVEHAQIHQRMLSQSTTNIRLPSEAEIAAKEAEEQEKLSAIKEVDLKVRFPDESSVVVKFNQADSGRSLYDFVRECLDARWKQDKFFLRNPAFRGIRGKSDVIPDLENKKLIKHLGLRGRVLVNFSWDMDGGASPEARAAKTVLKPELRQVAQKLEVKEVAALARASGEEDRGITVDLGKKEQNAGDGDKKKGGVPKWLKGLSKK